MLTIYPWHTENWNHIQSSWKNDRLPHALLLTGPDGIGINHFSTCLAYKLLCENRDDTTIACGTCKSCHLLMAGSHPDLLCIEPEEEGKQIKVDQIRNLINFINLKSQYGRYQIVIIAPAENMNRSTANTLLKTLEEPPPQSLIMLLSHRPALLPVTIRSRCQQLKFNPTYSAATLTWLSNEINDTDKAKELLVEARGAPLAAIALNENDILVQKQTILDDLCQLQDQSCDPVEIAGRWNKFNAISALKLLLELLNSMTKIKLAINSGTPEMNEQSEVLQRLANRLDLRKILQYYELVLKNYSLAASNISYNTQGLLEDIIVFWQQLDNQHGD